MSSDLPFWSILFALLALFFLVMFVIDLFSRSSLIESMYLAIPSRSPRSFWPVSEEQEKHERLEPLVDRDQRPIAFWFWVSVEFLLSLLFLYLSYRALTPSTFFDGPLISRLVEVLKYLNEVADYLDELLGSLDNRR